MSRSNHVAEIATTQYETAVLEAYGIMPMKENFPRFCNSAVYLPLISSLHDFGLSPEENPTNAEETQTEEQPSHCCRTEKERPKITKNDVLKAHGII
jgi:hypothetical protein